MPADALSSIAITLVGGVACQAIARRLRMPAIVPLLIAGMALGATGILAPSRTLGDGLPVIVGLAVAVILFEGGLSLKSESFRFAGRAIRRLVIVGAMLTWVASAALAHVLFPELGVLAAALFGALVIVTGPTVILPLLKSINPRQRVADVLRGEAILADPVGALLAVLAFEYLRSTLMKESTGDVLIELAMRIGIGLLLGGAGAWILDRLLRFQHDVAPDLKNRTVLVAAIGLYALSEAASHESGVLTVTIAGFGLGWLHPPGIEDIEEFKGHVVGLLVSMVFILLAAEVHPSVLGDLGVPGILLVAGLIVLVRPLSVFSSMVGTGLSLREKLFLSWIAPRGIVAASVSSLFAMELDRLGDPRGEVVRALTFAVIVGTVLVQGPTARFVGRLLGVLEGAATGFLIVGGSAVGRVVGRALHQAGHRVLLLDTNLSAVRRAREAGIPARRADALDDAAMESFDLDGLGALLAVTPNDNVNRLAIRLYGPEFGSGNIRAIRTVESPDETTSPWLFGSRLDLGHMERLLAEGATVEAATADEAIAVEAVASTTGMIPLMAFDAERRPRFLDDAAALVVGETILYLDTHRDESA
ncbi:MAG: hypothetical protein CL908_26885 [Deltaproteobacteria bacterium]|nr:hypothetical protein [Deltaproteobacteria bacterium]